MLKCSYAFLRFAHRAIHQGMQRFRKTLGKIFLDRHLDLVWTDDEDERVGKDSPEDLTLAVRLGCGAWHCSLFEVCHFVEACWGMMVRERQVRNRAFDLKSEVRDGQRLR